MTRRDKFKTKTHLKQRQNTTKQSDKIRQDKIRQHETGTTRYDQMRKHVARHGKQIQVNTTHEKARLDQYKKKQ